MKYIWIPDDEIEMSKLRAIREDSPQFLYNCINYIYMYIYTRIYTYIYTYIYTRTHIHTYMGTGAECVMSLFTVVLFATWYLNSLFPCAVETNLFKDSYLPSCYRWNGHFLFEFKFCQYLSNIKTRRNTRRNKC